MRHGCGNALLPEFLVRYNEHFAVEPLRPEDLHRSSLAPAQ